MKIVDTNVFLVSLGLFYKSLLKVFSKKAGCSKA
jgi:hypothetical protein